MLPKDNELPATTYEAKQLVPYAVHCVTRLEKMILEMSRGSLPGREFLRRLYFKRLFRNKDNAKLMRWHKEERKQDSMLRHPANWSQWRKIDKMN